MKCGQALNQAEPQRALDREDALTEAAARMLGVQVEALNTFALARAGRDAVRDLTDRDFGREMREEQADARNYAVWWLEQLSLTRLPADHAAAEARSRIANALAYVAAAFEEVRAAERLLAD